MSEKQSFFSKFKIGSKKEIDIDTIYEEAVNLFKNKDFENSKSKFQQILNIDPNNKGCVINLSKIYNHQNNHSESINILKKYLENNPNSFDMKLRLSNSYMKMSDFETSIGILNQLKNTSSESKDLDKITDNLIKVYNSQIESFKKEKKYKEAIYTYEDIFKLNNDKEAYLFNMALMYMDIKNYSKSKDLFNELIENKKTNKSYIADAYYNLGKIEELENKDHKALSVYQEALSKHLTKEDTYFFKGKIDFLNKKYEESIKEFSESIKHKKYIFDSYLSLGDCYLNLRQYSKALEAYNNSIELIKNAKSILLSILCLIQLKDTEKALNKINKLNEKVFIKYPNLTKDIALALFELNFYEEGMNLLTKIKNILLNDPEISVYIAKYNKYKGDKDFYNQEIQNAFKINPHNYIVMREYAKYLNENDNINEALKIYDKMLQTWIKNKEPLKLKADIYESQNNIKELIKTLEEYLSFENDIDSIYKLGFLYFNNINMDKAINILNKIRNVKKYAFEVNSLLTNIYISKGDTNNAFQCLEKCIEISPTYIDGYIKYAKLLSNMGDTNKAIKYLKHAKNIDPNNKDIESLLISYS